MYVLRPSVYTPGAGHRPPVLAGREELVARWRVMLSALAARGRPGARDVIVAGPRGIGKTALVLEYGDICREQGYEVVNLQAAAGTTGLVDSVVRQAARRAEAGAGPWQRARHVFERIASVNLSVAGTGAGVAFQPPVARPGGVTPEDLADALATLAGEVRGERAGGGVLITVDEMQSADCVELALLAAALQRLNADHATSCVAFAATGLPTIGDRLEAAGVTHADRLFDIRHLPLTLGTLDATYAVVEPARLAGVIWDPDAARAVVEATNGYPAHLQLFADHSWSAATSETTVTTADAARGVQAAAGELEARTFGPRLERLTGRQAEVLTALAALGGRASRHAVVATLGQTSPGSISRVRDELLAHGDIYAPAYGELALTVPLMGDYLLGHYEQRRARSGTSLVPLGELRRRAGGGGGGP